MLWVVTLHVTAQSIKPGETWKDTDGSAINAHGGCVVYTNGYYYWFGEQRKSNKSDGISCYRSADLYTWKKMNRAVVPTGTMTDADTDIASGRTLERPKVIYNEQTSKWVMWIHWENGSDYGQAKVAVCTADKVEGPYSLVSVFRPNNCDSRDQTLFADTDGNAYHVYSTNMNNNTNCERLSSDYLTPLADYVVQLKGRKYEAASLFKVGDIYYGLFSGCTGWTANPGRYMWTYDLMEEMWNAPADFKASDKTTGVNFCVDAGKDNTYQSQSNYVFPVPGKDKCFIYMGDRWNSSNVQSSKHVWLPLSVRSGYPSVRWYDSWNLSVFDKMYRYKRLSQPIDGAEVCLLEKYSNRLVAKPGSALTLEDDEQANLALVLHATEDPWTWKIEQKETGKYLESVYGTTRWQAAVNRPSQEWKLVLEEDGYYRIQNANDGVCLSVSGNGTEAGTTVYLGEVSANVHQSFSLYFDSNTHSDYQEADMFSTSYRQRNRELMDMQQSASNIVSRSTSGEECIFYNLLTGRKIMNKPIQRGIYIEIKGGQHRKFFIP